MKLFLRRLLCLSEPKPKAPKGKTEWQRFIERHPVGSLVSFLGQDMMVTRATDFVDLGENLGWDNGEFRLHYLDNQRKLQSITWHDDQLHELFEIIKPASSQQTQTKD